MLFFGTFRMKNDPKLNQCLVTLALFVARQSDVGGHVLFLPHLCSELSENPVRCLSAVRFFCLVSVCPGSVCFESVRCADSAWTFEKMLSVFCLFVRTRLSGLLVSLSADLCYIDPSRVLKQICFFGYFFNHRPL